MNTVAAAVLLVSIAFLLATLPFLTRRVFFAFAPKVKTVWWCLLELLVFYGVFILLGFGLEANVGRAHPQAWQFYAITLLMFLVLAYPGFVWRFLRRGAKTSA
jgi:hypothetical protein